MAAPPPSASDGDSDRLRPALELVERFRVDLARLSVAEWSSPLVVAVSGGPDSVALLLLSAAVAPARVVAATVDHRLRPASADEAAMVAGLCARLGVPHRTLTGALPNRVDGSANLSQRARQLRYDLLGRLASEVGAGAIMTAHHADDQLETVIMRLNRGSGVTGLAGIRRETGNVVRPLLGWRHAELTELVSAAGIAAIDDPTNHDDRFDRARLRRALSAADWLDATAVAASARHLGDAVAAIEWAADRLIDQFATFAKGEARLLAFGLPAEMKRRFVVACLRHVQPGIDPRGETLNRVVASLDDEATVTAGRVLCDIVWMPLPGAGKMPLWRFRAAPPRRSL